MRTRLKTSNSIPDHVVFRLKTSLIKCCILLCMLLFSSAPKAADTIIVNKDSRLDLLTQKQAEINKRTSMMTSSGQYKGYRIQVLSTHDRQLAFRVKTDLLANYPDQKSYIFFRSPYFKVRIGDFLKRSDAESFRKQLTGTYPQGGYIVADVIDYTPEEN